MNFTSAETSSCYGSKKVYKKILTSTFLLITIFLWLSFYSLSGYSQKLTILDSQNLPIQGVKVTSNRDSITLVSDSLGQVDLTAFQEAETVRFFHKKFEAVIYTYEQLKKMNFEVVLNKKNVTLNEVVISANRWEQNLREIPHRVEIIKMREVAFQNPQTTADLLGTSGYVFIQKSQLGGGSPMIRGMATSRLLIVVDGVRMNNAIFRSGNLQNVISLDANALQKTEVLFGPGSVIYGSDAIGGVMNFQTLIPQFLSSDETSKISVSGNAFSRYSTANQEKTQHLDLNLKTKKFSFLTLFTYADYQDLRSGAYQPIPDFYRRFYVLSFHQQDYMIPNPDSTLQIGSKYHQVNLMQKIRWKPSAFWDIEYGFHLSQTSNYGRYDRLTVMKDSLPRWAEWYYGPQKWQMHRLGFSFSKPTLLFDTMKLILAYQFFEESRYDRRFNSTQKNAQIENVPAYSLNLDFNKNINPQFSLTYGIENVYNQVISRAHKENIRTYEKTPSLTRYPNGSLWFSHALFASLMYKPQSKWAFNGGLRANHFYVYTPFDTSLFPFPYKEARISVLNVSSHVGAVWIPDENWKLYLNISNGFRAPNVDDISKVFESTPGYVVVPNPNLKPEKVFNLELGNSKTWGNFLRWDITGYHTWLYDAMVRKNYSLNGDTLIDYNGSLSRVQAIQNVAKIRVYGFQIGLELFYKNFKLRSTYSYQKGQEENTDSLAYYPLRHAAPAFGSTHLTYENTRIRVNFYVNYQASLKYKDLALTERENPSYARDNEGKAYVASWYTLNFKVAYFPQEQISIGLGVENILDKMYRPYASGINAPGRNWIASLRVKF